MNFVYLTPGGTASVYVGQPLDTVKVKMQTFPTLHTNAYRCFVTTLRQEGIPHGLYAGTVPSLAAQVGCGTFKEVMCKILLKSVLKIVQMR